MNASAPRAAAPAEQPAAPPSERRVTLPPLDYAFQTLLTPVRKALERIEAQIKSLQAGSIGHPPPPPPGAESGSTSNSNGGLTIEQEVPLAPLHLRFDQLSAELAEFRRDALSRLELQAPAVADAKPGADTTSVAAQAGSSNGQEGQRWDEIILGTLLCSDPRLMPTCQQFLGDVISGCVAARALAGQLLLLQATAADELPERFRHVGEAYYRWRPSSSSAEDPFEKSLADWLTRCAEMAGLRNSIQLVRPGDRFDSTRHSAATRGVEVVGVHGWIVLRDNQKVYTKASVTVQ